MIPLNEISAIDLNKHGLFEASAGTGKTYTIEHLIARIICEKKVPLQKILIVTFTEKATGELIFRIRAQLLEILKNDHDESVKTLIRESLDQFDQASIFTIHGFCQNILSEYQFESGSAFNVALADDPVLQEEIIREEIIKSLPVFFGKDLSVLLELIGFKEADFQKSIVSILSDYKEHPQYKLYPSVTSEGLTEQVAFVKQEFEQLSDLCQNALFDELEGSKSFKIRCDVPFKNTIQFLKNYKKDGFENYNMLKKFEWPDHFKKKLDFSDDLKILLEDFLQKLDALSSNLASLNSSVLSWFSVHISSKAREYKIQHNLMSFDDMLLNTYQLINSDNKDEVIAKIREKFSFVLVDEFQDTDIIQWDIFEKLFLQGPKNILYLIGDPKQSIYRFRNADIKTYLDAKNKLINLEVEGKAHLYSLQTNYRSFPKLVTGFNELFKCDGLFGEDSAIKHFDCLSSERSINNFPHLKPEAAGVKVIKVDPAHFNESTYFNLITPMVCNEIWQLKRSNEKVLFENFCLLITARSNFKIIEPIFNAMGIPISLYKESGIKATKEAIELKYLFSAIDDPSDCGKRSLALLTSFFKIAPVELSNYAELSSDHLIMKKLIRWNGLACDEQWPELFQSIIEFSGVMFLEEALIVSENRISKYKQILEWLLTISLEESLKLKDVIIKLEVFSSDNSTIADEDNKVKSATDKDKVQVMTIHTSKGLEFPFVFNLSRPKEESKLKVPFWVNHDDHNVIVLDDLNDEYNQKCLGEDRDEFKRLQYVACTRAIHSLYLFDTGDRPAKSLYVESIGKPINQLLIDQPDCFTELEADGVLHKVDVSKVELDQKKVGEAIHKENFETIERNKYSRQLYMKSFSSLSSDHYQKELQGDGDKSFKSDDDYEVSTEEDQLPRGANTGNLIHHIFENISFERVSEFTKLEDGFKQFVGDEDCLSLIKNSMDEHQFNHVWLEQITKMIWDTLTSKMFSFDPAFRLCDLKSKDRIHEMEFYFPLPNVSKENSSKGLMQGFIDLVFVWQEKFYILDWKSNYSDAGYQREQLQGIMEQHEYDLQYKIYMVSVYRWLNSIMGEGFSWSESFGGVVYLFVRGVDLDKPEESAGVYFESGEKTLSLKKIRDLIVEKLTSKSYV